VSTIIKWASDFLIFLGIIIMISSVTLALRHERFSQHKIVGTTVIALPFYILGLTGYLILDIPTDDWFKALLINPYFIAAVLPLAIWLYYVRGRLLLAYSIAELLSGTAAIAVGVYVTPPFFPKALAILEVCTLLSEVSITSAEVSPSRHAKNGILFFPNKNLEPRAKCSTRTKSQLILLLSGNEIWQIA
jgi:hypothetical protein